MKDSGPFPNTWLPAPYLLPHLCPIAPQPLRKGWVHEHSLLCPAVVEYFQAQPRDFQQD